MTRTATHPARGSRTRTPRLEIEDLTTQEMVMLKICEFTAGLTERCACLYSQRRRPSCRHLNEVAAKICADVRLFDARAREKQP